MLNIGPRLICLWKTSPSEESWELQVVPTPSRKLCLRRKSTSIRLVLFMITHLKMTRDHSNTSQNISPTPASWQELPRHTLKNTQTSLGGLTEPTNFFIKLLRISINFPLTICPFCMSWSQIRAVRLYPAFVSGVLCGRHTVELHFGSCQWAKQGAEICISALRLLGPQWREGHSCFIQRSMWTFIQITWAYLKLLQLCSIYLMDLWFVELSTLMELKCMYFSVSPLWHLLWSCVS